MHTLHTATGIYPRLHDRAIELIRTNTSRFCTPLPTNNRTVAAARRILLVQKPYMERRSYATFMKQWDMNECVSARIRCGHRGISCELTPPTSGAIDVRVTSPQVSFDAYCSGDIPIEQVIDLMIGDLERIREYPRLGFQIPQPMSEEVWQAAQELIALGFNKHLLKPPTPV